MSATAPKRVVRVLIVDDDPLFRLAVAAMLNAGEDVEVIASEAADGEAAVAAVAASVPDVVVMDLNMSRLDGIEAARTIGERWPHVRVVMVAKSDDARADSSRAEAAGIDAFVDKANLVERELRTVALR